MIKLSPGRISTERFHTISHIDFKSLIVAIILISFSVRGAKVIVEDQAAELFV